MSLLTLAGGRASITVQGREILHWTWCSETSYWICCVVFFCLSSVVGPERKKGVLSLKFSAVSFVKVGWLGIKKEKKGLWHEQHRDYHSVEVPKGNGQNHRDKWESLGVTSAMMMRDHSGGSRLGEGDTVQGRSPVTVNYNDLGNWREEWAEEFWTGVLGEDEESKATDRDWGFTQYKVTRAFRDSLFSGVLRRKQAGARELGVGVFYPFSKMYDLERKQKRVVPGSKEGFLFVLVRPGLLVGREGRHR